MAEHKADCYAYVRGNYQVPAYVGVRVRVGQREGVLVAARSDLHYIHVRFDWMSHALPAHPTNDVQYLLASQAT